ncbi:MAG: hypothetical protein M9947_07660 [Thermomicrobiales bacterium]|nr:hypothetical protein [Thermomicrobiales bacterium]
MSAPPFDIQQLLDPAAYPWPVDEVRLIETHISWVLLAGDKVVKLKRPVDLGFVDFRDPAKRKQACEDEVRLNRRLTTDVYLGVVPVTADGVDATGEPLEWATLMRRMPADRMLDVLLREDAAPDDLAQRLADRLIPFHQSSFHPIVILNEVKDLSRSDAPDNPPTEEQAFASARGEILRVAQNDNGGRSEPAEGSRATRGPSAAVGTTGVAVGTTKCPADPDVYLTVLTDNLDQVAEAAGDILGPAQLALVDRSMRRYLTAERELLDARFETWLGEGHGDLRCEHICLEPDAMQIYDCVEFEIAIRCADVASDLAFLLMDLRRLGAQEVAAELLERYRAAGFDLPQPVVDLYAAHRALVRAKVAALERSGRDADRDRVFAFEAASYLDLATAFATPIAPMLVLVSGLSGSGKSTVAAAIARVTGGTVFASDRVH